MMPREPMSETSAPEGVEIELGETVEVERPARTGLVLSIRFTPQEADQLQRLADERRMPLTELVRELVLSQVRTTAPAEITAR